MSEVRAEFLARQLESTEKLLRHYQEEEFKEKVETLRKMTNGDWKRVIEDHPELLAGIERGRALLDQDK